MRMCPAEHDIIHSADPCRHPTVHSRKLGDMASHKSLSSCVDHVDHGTPRSDDLFCVDFIVECSMEVATAAHISKRVFLPLCGLSLTLPRANARFSQSSSVAVRVGALLNHSWNAAITWDMVCSMCCLSCTHTLATKRSSIEQMLVSAIQKTNKFYGCGKSRVHYLAHCCQNTILHCTACCDVLSNLILSLRCILSGCTVTSCHPVGTVACLVPCTLLQTCSVLDEIHTLPRGCIVRERRCYATWPRWYWCGPRF